MTKTTVTTTTTINSAPSKNKWTYEEDQVLKAVIAKKGTIKDAAKKLNRTEKAISMRAYVLRNSVNSGNFYFASKAKGRRKATKRVPTRHTAKVTTLNSTVPTVNQAAPDMRSVNLAAYAVTTASIAVLVSLLL
jgi:hypothetical protein